MGAGASLDEMPSHQVGRSVGAHAGRSVDLLAIKLAKLSEVPSTRNPAAATQPGFSQPSPRRLIAGQVQGIQPAPIQHSIGKGCSASNKKPDCHAREPGFSSQWGLIAGPVQAIVQPRLTHDKIGCFGSLSLGLYASELGIQLAAGLGVSGTRHAFVES